MHRLFVFTALFAVAGVSPAIAQKPSASALGNPCQLLTDAEVRTVFTGAKAGRVDRRREEYGLVDCIWEYPGGSFGLQLSAAPSQSFDEEVKGNTTGFLDPMKGGAERAIRFEKLTGVGDRATAIVEATDRNRGILTNIAMLIAQRGKREIVLGSPDLVKRDRAAALKALQDLGKAAASRL
jgi:hypothetical protein